MNDFSVNNQEVKSNIFLYFLSIFFCACAIFIFPLWTTVYPFFHIKTPLDNLYIFEGFGDKVLLGGYVEILFFGIFRYFSRKYRADKYEIIFAWIFSFISLISSIIGLSREEWFWIISPIIYSIIFSVFAPFVVLLICRYFSKAFLENSDKKKRYFSIGLTSIIFVVALTSFIFVDYPEIKTRMEVVKKNDDLAAGKGNYVELISNNTVATKSISDAKNDVLVSTGYNFSFPEINNDFAVNSKYQYYLRAITISSNTKDPRIDLELWGSEEKIDESWSTRAVLYIHELVRRQDKESLCQNRKSDRQVGTALDNDNYCGQEKIDQYGEKGRKDLTFFKGSYLIFISTNDEKLSWEDLEDLALSFK